MPAVLKRDKTIPLKFTPGTILVLKPAPLAKPPASFKFALGLYNEKGDVLLLIEFSPGHVVFYDRARRSLGEGYGEERKVNTTNMDLKGRSLLDVKVSIHHYLSDSEFGGYQILFNGITIAHFKKRLPGLATKISYFQGTDRVPPSWDVDVYQIDDILPEDRLALVPRRARSPPILSLDSMAISIRPSHFIPTQTYASTGISWDDGKEIRLYYLGPRNFLHEYAYSARNDINNWHYGNLHTLKIILNPTSSISAVRHNDDTMCVYYQDPNTNFIRMVNQCGSSQPWKEALPIAKAVRSSSFAIIRDPTNKLVSRIYYQDPELHLKELCYDHLGNTDQGVFGDFAPGVQPKGTPITAEVVQGGDVDINVTWRDSQGRVASASWSKSSGWDLPDPNNGREQLDGRD